MKKKTKEKCKTSNNTIKKQQLAREKGKNRDHEEYTYRLMKNQNEIGTEERRRRQKKNVRHQIIIISKNNK